MIIDSRFSLSTDCNVFDKKKLKFLTNVLKRPGVYKWFQKWKVSYDSVSPFSWLVLLAQSISSLMYNPTPPPWPLFLSRLIKLYPRISKKALWTSSLIEVSDKLNKSKLYDNKISRTSSIFPYKPLIFWWQK